MKAIIAALFLIGSLTSAAQAQNLVVNGSFETQDLNGWAFNFDPAVAVTKGYGATDGEWALEFGNGDTNGTSLRQTIATVAGSTYTVTFDWKSTHPDWWRSQSLTFSALDGSIAAPQESDSKDPPKAQEIIVLQALQVSGSYTGDFNPASPFLSFSTTFVANSSSTTIVFQDTSASSYQADQVLDRISVTAVPEPEAYAMLLSGLGLIGAIARRRKPKQVG